jgi:hypothetical protein
MRLRSVGGASVLALVSVLLTEARLPAAALPEQLQDQIACDLPGDHAAEVDVLDRLDQLREDRGLSKLERSCRLSGLAATWLASKPADDTYDSEGTLAALCDLDWQKITATLQVAPSVDEAWDRMLTDPSDIRNLADDQVETVGASVRVADDQTWVYLVSVAKNDRPLSDTLVPGGVPTLMEILRHAIEENPAGDVRVLEAPTCAGPPEIVRPVWN